jgi:nitrogen fixation protein NifB
VKVNTIILPGINDHHIETIAQTVSRFGAATCNCIPLHPVEGTEFASLPRPDHELMQKVRWNASQHINVVRHCARCRSDAAGLLGSANSSEIERLLKSCGSMPLDPEENRPFSAVASREGMLVNEHLGRARNLYIYKETPSGFECVETRQAPPGGNGPQRWEELATLLSDCRFLLVNQVGDSPKAHLADAGIKVIATAGMIEDALGALYAGKDPTPVVNGGRCSGSGGGCGG